MGETEKKHKSTADEIVETDRARPRNQWFDEDCEKANREENEKKMQARKTRALIESFCIFA